MATGVGLILGDLPTGLAMGAVGELAFMGFGVSQGGSVPPNPMGPGIIGSLHSNGRCQRHSDKSAGQ